MLYIIFILLPMNYFILSSYLPVLSVILIIASMAFLFLIPLNQCLPEPCIEILHRNPLIQPLLAYNPVKLRLKTDLVSYPARSEGLGKYDQLSYGIYSYTTQNSTSGLAIGISVLSNLVKCFNHLLMNA